MLQRMPRRALPLAASPSFAKLGILTVGIWLSACVAPALQMNPASNLVNVRGIVFDSLTHTRLSGARIAFTAADSVGGTVIRAITDSNGTFAISLRSGAWLAAVEHPRFDSLRVSVPLGRVMVPDAAAFTLQLGTDLPGAITRALCGSNVRNDVVALVGMVRNAATNKGLDSASVFVKWVDVKLTLRGFTRSTQAVVTRTTRDGWYVRCDVPAAATVVSWAARGGATTGAVLYTLTGAPARLDLTLDTTARPSNGSVELDPDSSAGSLFPLSAGTARYHVIVRDANGRPLPNARVRILGRTTARSDAAGAVTLDSIASGTQTLEVSSIGYQPQRRVVDVAVGGEPTDTVFLASLKSVLDTIRITSGRDPTGFELRRSTRVGQFITAEDVARENPARITQLLRTRKLLRYTFDRNGFALIDVDHSCLPLILIDGFPPYPGFAPKLPGEAELDWLMHPDEIGGVEIYTSPAQLPAEIARLSFGPPPCAAIVFWTRESLGLPKAAPLQP
jgi:Carboxypeptidase regulatory-like domain